MNSTMHNMNADNMRVCINMHVKACVYVCKYMSFIKQLKHSLLNCIAKSAGAYLDVCMASGVFSRKPFSVCTVHCSL